MYKNRQHPVFFLRMHQCCIKQISVRNTVLYYLWRISSDSSLYVSVKRNTFGILFVHILFVFMIIGNVQLTADLAVIFPKYSLFKFTFYQFQEFLLSHEPVEKILQSSLISYFREKFLMIRTPDDRILRVVI